MIWWVAGVVVICALYRYIRTNITSKVIKEAIGKNALVKGTKLGQGNFGEVFEYRHGNHVIAGKHIYVRSQSELDAIKREFELANVVKHRNLVSVYHVVIPNSLRDPVIIFMEKLSSLTSLIGSGDDRQSAVQRIIKDVCSGLAALHKALIIHSDIKPDNILHDGGTAKLTDFGVSTTLHRLGVDAYMTSATMRGASRLFLAPECLDRGTCSKKSDVYAVGVTYLVLMDYGNAVKRFQQSGHNPPSVSWHSGDPVWLKDVLNTDRDKRPSAEVLGSKL